MSKQYLAAEPPFFPCDQQGNLQVAKTSEKFNLTPHQSLWGFATHVHGFATKTEALARKILPAAQAKVEAI